MIKTRILRGAAVFAALAMTATAGCSDGGGETPDAGMPQPDAPGPGTTYRQIEQLARPGINEALLFTAAFNNGYNATAPSFAGVPTETLNAVVAEAKTVLKALYLGACFINGAIKLSAAAGVKPAGIQCHAVGEGLFVENTLAGVTLTEASKAAAAAYAEKVFAQFIPDVMRVDTALPTSRYQLLCGDANSTPLLCGGRFLNNDVIDTTFVYLLAGAAIDRASPAQFRALVSDGVVFSYEDSNNIDSLSFPDTKNAQQDHPNVSPAFPYSAAPF
jgi:tRNA-binding EMAP/Myf-like protein